MSNYIPPNYENITSNIKNAMNSSDIPLSFSDITSINSRYIPSTIKQRNNRAYHFWCRALYERAMSVFIWTIPELWYGAQMDLLRYSEARFGYGMVAYEKQFGYFFQPCGLTGYGFFYQPVKTILSNPMLNKEYTIGKDCELLRMTHDYMGIWDTIDYFAKMLAQIDTSINTALVNSKNAWMLFAREQSGGKALKKAYDLISQGEPAMVFDERAFINDKNPESKDVEPLIKVDLDALKNAQIVGIQLQDLQTILTMFDTEVGIQTVGGNQAKKERLTEFESESKEAESTARCTIWLNELQESCTRINKMFPELNLWVELRKEEEEEDNANDQHPNGI